MEFVKQGSFPLFFAHLGVSCAFPIVASRIHSPETREYGFIASACLNGAVGTYGAYRVWTLPRRPIPWAYVLMFVNTLPCAFLQASHFLEFQTAQKQLGGQRPLIRVYQSTLLPQYFAHVEKQAAQAKMQRAGVLSLSR